MIEQTRIFELNKLYKNLSPNIISMYQHYNYLELTKEEFTELIKQFIEDIYNNNNNQKQNIDINYYIKNIKRYLYMHIKLKIQDNNSIKIIVNYIDYKLNYYPDGNNIKELKRLCNFLSKYEYNLTPDLCVEIINASEKINTILKNIVETNYQKINKNGIESIEDNETIVEFIENYCMINKIEFQKEKDDEKEEDILLSEEFDKSILDSVTAYLIEIQRPKLTETEEKKLGERILQGDISARDKLVEHNLRWVVTLAKHYQNKGLDLLELIQEGNIGLITAANKFDYTKGFRFTTYSSHWIKQSIRRAIADKSRMVRVPVHMHQKIIKYNTTKINLESKLNRIPTIEEISKESDLKISEIEEILIYSQDTISINSLVGDEEDTELENFIPSPSDTPEEAYTKIDLPKEIKIVLESCSLTERQIHILLLRSGYYDGNEKTLEEVGQIFGITRERIRQLENKALKKIRRSPHVKRLIDYTDNPNESTKNLAIFREFYNQNISSNKSLQNQKEIKGAKDTIEKHRKELAEDEKFNNEELNHNSKTIQLLNNNQLTEPKRAIFTIFDTFKNLGYTKEEVLSVIEKLQNLDKKRLYLRNGKDLDNPVISPKITDRDRRLYITTTLPKIEKLLLSTYGYREPPIEAKPKVSIYDKLSTKSKNNKQRVSKPKNYNDYNTNHETKENIEVKPAYQQEEDYQMNYMTIFEYFELKGYNKETIKLIMTELSEKDIEIIRLRNGNDLDNPILNKNITQSQRITYINILKKILNKLEEKNGEKQVMKEDNNINDEKINLDNNTEETVLTTSNDETQKQIITLDTEVTTEKSNVETSSTQTTRKRKNNRMTIYENIGRYGYTKEEIISIINELSTQDKEMIKLIDGEDLDNPVKSEKATKMDVTKYHTNLIPKIIRKLKSKYGIRESKTIRQKNKANKTQSNKKTNITKPQEKVTTTESTNVIKKNTQTAVTPTELPKTTTNDSIIQNELKENSAKILCEENNKEVLETITEERKVSDAKEIEKEDYIKILELLKTPTFYDLMTKLPAKEAIIIALRLGYIDGKYFSTESISSFLGIEKEEVRVITTKILNLHKENLNNMIDNIKNYLNIEETTAPLKKKINK